MLYQQQNSTGKYFFELIRYRNFSYERHMHRHYELIYVREGAVAVQLPFCSELIKKGELAFIPSNCLHSYQTPGSSVVDVCIFSADFVPLFARGIRRKRIESCRFVCRPSVMDFALRELFVENHIPDLFTAKAVLYAVAGEILHNIPFRTITEQKDVTTDRLIEYIAENFREDISLASAAQALDYEKHYLSRCFHRSIPMNFSKYVNLFRVDAASELLQDSELSVTEIALASGFQSIRTFNRVFLEVTGKTPGRFG